jgi:hypothetical protein
MSLLYIKKCLFYLCCCFQVTGFSVAGRVVDNRGAGIENAKVILDGQLKTVTDSLGYYKLDQVCSL